MKHIGGNIIELGYNSVLDMSGGNFTVYGSQGCNYGCVFGDGTLNMTGGKIISYASNAIFASVSEGDYGVFTLNLSGGEIYCYGEWSSMLESTASRCSCTISDSVSIYISENYDYGIWMSDGTLNITGGTITKDGDGYAVYVVGGTATQTGGTIVGNTYWGEEN